MKDIEARIAEVLAAHDKFTYDAEHRETTCAGCGWAITNVMNPDHEDKFHDRKRVHQAQVIAAALAPVIREREAEAWETGHQAGWEEHENPGPFVNDYWDSEAPNPYRNH